MLCRHYPEMKSSERKHLQMRIFYNKKARFVIVTFELQPKVSCAKETVYMVISTETINNKLYVLDENS